MAHVSSFTFNNMARIGNDNCDVSQKISKTSTG